MAEIITRETINISEDDWNIPALLDAFLISRGMIRSDSGFPAGESILAAEIKEEDREYLEEISAALSLQRAMIAVMTCEREKPDILKIRNIVDRVESRGYTHESLLRDEIVHSIKKSPVVYPPESVFQFKEGTVLGLLRRSLDAMNGQSYGIEACGVANSLLVSSSILDGLNPAMYTEFRASEGQEYQDPCYPLEIRNNLAWLAKNPHCSNEQISKYLEAYGTTIETLISRIEEINNKNQL